MIRIQIMDAIQSYIYFYGFSGSAKVVVDASQHESQFSQFFPLQEPGKTEAQGELMGPSENEPM